MDTSFNIVNLIENSPVVRLSRDYNNRFINKIKENFTETQQHLFVSSFYSYLNYHPTTDFVIDLDNVWKWLGFSQKAVAKRTLDKYFIIDKDYKVLLCRSAEQTNDGRGGHNKETILLNIRTFKLFCIKAGTEKANEIHEYFVKLEDIMHQIVQEENNELKQQLEDINKNFDEKLKNEKISQKQKMLLDTYGHNMSIVYVIRVKSYENGEYVIKIGESRNGVENRYREHTKNYEECILLDCFQVNKSKQFEHFLHHHIKIRPNKVKNLEGHTNENELFLIGKHLTYYTVVQIINDNIKQFNEWTVNDIVGLIQEENQKFLEKLIPSANVIMTSSSSQSELDPAFLRMTPLASLDTSSRLIPNQNDAVINKLLEKIDNLEQTNKQILEKIDKPKIKTATNFNTELVTLGQRVQQINPETGALVKVYESVSDCKKQNKHEIHPPSLKMQ